jgi:hypothetical protein
MEFADGDRAVILIFEGDTAGLLIMTGFDSIPILEEIRFDVRLLLLAFLVNFDWLFFI